MISIFLFCSRDERDFGLEAETEIRLVSVLVSSCSALFWFYSYVLYSHFVSVLIAFLFFYYFLIHSNSFIFPFLLCLFSFWFHSYSLSFWSYSSLSWHSVLIPFCFCSHSVIVAAWRSLQSIKTPRGLWFLHQKSKKTFHIDFSSSAGVFQGCYRQFQRGSRLFWFS